MPSFPKRILVLSDKITATQFISFQQPLARAAERGELELTLMTGSKSPAELRRVFTESQADLLVLSRCTKPGMTVLPPLCHKARIPCVYHLDDDLLNVPLSVGGDKFSSYNDPARLDTIRTLITSSDLLYTSTAPLRQAMAEFESVTAVVNGEVYCTVDAADLPLPTPSPWPVIGYMGSGSHARDLELALPAIERLMEAIPILRFEVFGSIEMPEPLKRFGARVMSHEADTNYTGFLRKLQSLGWWIGLAPLEDHVFNRCKADTKWVEYTSAGIATVTSDIPVYARACEGGAGLMAATPADWFAAAMRLLTDHHLRNAVVTAARKRLLESYTHTLLEQQLAAVFARAAERAAAR